MAATGEAGAVAGGEAATTGESVGAAVAGATGTGTGTAGSLGTAAGAVLGQAGGWNTAGASTAGARSRPTWGLGAARRRLPTRLLGVAAGRVGRQALQGQGRGGWLGAACRPSPGLRQR